MGPEDGDAGGQVVAVGTPEEVAACPASHTGRYLRPLLERGGQAVVSAPESPPAKRARKREKATA